MNLTSDYFTQVLIQQRHQELLATAASDRLARLALSGRQRWWRRLMARAAGARVTKPATPSASSMAARTGPPTSVVWRAQGATPRCR